MMAGAKAEFFKGAPQRQGAGAPEASADYIECHWLRSFNDPWNRRRLVADKSATAGFNSAGLSCRTTAHQDVRTMRPQQHHSFHGSAVADHVGGEATLNASFGHELPLRLKTPVQQIVVALP
jgi:hypothetical protein